MKADDHGCDRPAAAGGTDPYPDRHEPAAVETGSEARRLDLHCGSNVKVVSEALDRQVVSHDVADHPGQHFLIRRPDLCKRFCGGSRLLQGFSLLKKLLQHFAAIRRPPHRCAIDGGHGIRTRTLNPIGRDRLRRRQCGYELALDSRDPRQEIEIGSEVAALGECLEATGAIVEEACQIRLQDKRCLGNAADHRWIGLYRGYGHFTSRADRPQLVSGYSAGSIRPRPASSLSHLRWCLHAQPPVTEPFVIARNVPRVQKAA